ncbi:4'-phosphopantetheinyl transferase superfamily protein [Cryobacterium melibiosiphilum]|uniref:4'-phosphopantetheinyl transferase superfamily protein n=1 Tax=Cryobacterium melibiosiphilum TaxID=995039 RepID=A0A3A5MFK7_9MICO|nr:4'-phosphopantetheinyl transferase superfamily protein [Cryobacterium melibiosiphilum]RJT86197.1 4'-phosphopantetheinyl transferase superfamily protein [Cryobacterium melibiosiphilum]
MSVHVFLGPRGVTDAADRLALRAAVAEVAGSGTALSSVGLEQRCTRCGGAHGRARVVSPAACVSWGVSLSRAGASVAVAVNPSGPIGIDIESIAALAHRAVDDVAFTPGELARLGDLPPCPAARARTRLWTIKEAVLKLTGDGLNVDPRDLVTGAGGTLESWPDASFSLVRLHLLTFDAGPGLVGTIAVLGDTPPGLMLHT